MAVVSDFRAILGIYDNSSYRWNATVQRKVPVFVSYSFFETSDLPSAYSMPYSVTSTTVFSEAQRDAFRKALAAFEKVTGVRFVETTGDAMIRAHGVTGSAWGGWANYPSVNDYSTSTGNLVLDLTNGDKTSGFAFEVILHELGHTLGLSHPHSGTYTLSSDLDSTRTTVMSYNWDSVSYATPRPMDVNALKYLYGPEIDTTGWSWEFRDGAFQVSGANGNDQIMGVRGKNVISGAGGADLLIGREDVDKLKGGFGNDILKGMGGADRLDGGGGDDMLWASDNNMPDYNANVLLGAAGNDKLAGMQGADRLLGGPGNDILWGSAKGVVDYSANLLKGGGGNDRLFGRSGNDKLNGQAGNDRLYGQNSDDTMFGGTGDDIMDGGQGNDRIFGQDGMDRLYGKTENDWLDGGPDDDILVGGPGNDVIRGNSGKDLMTGGSGFDTFLFRKQAAGFRDVITDLELGQDVIQLDDVGFTGADARIAKANGGVDSVIIFDGDGGFSIYLEGVTKAELLPYVSGGLFI